MDNLISLDAQLESASIGLKVELLANDLVLMEAQLEEQEFFVNQRRKQLLEAMDAAGLASVQAQSGTKITVIESQKYNIDDSIAKQIIENAGLQDQLLKVNESKFRELFPISEAVSLGKKSRYIKVSSTK